MVVRNLSNKYDETGLLVTNRGIQISDTKFVTTPISRVLPSADKLGPP